MSARPTSPLRGGPQAPTTRAHAQDAATAGEDAWQTRLGRLTRILPLPMLAAATGLAALIVAGGYSTWTEFRYGLIVAGVAAVWTVGVTLRPPSPSARVRLAQYAVHTALAATLVAINPWFGLFAWTGFLLDGNLPHGWDRAGLAVTGLILAASQMGGFPTHPIDIIGYVLIAAVNVGLALVVGTMTHRVIEQNEERGRIIAQLEAVMRENEGLHAQLVAQAREAGIHDERRRMAGEIHDTLAQGLAGIVTQLEAATQARHLPEQWRRHLEQAQTLARESLAAARRSVQALRPEQLDALALPEALRAYADQWSRRNPIASQVEVTGQRVTLPTDTEAALFRIAQEALANVAKHAHASKAWLTLSYLDDVVLLDVRDDGVGFDPDADTGGVGLRAMRERIGRVGGQLAVESRPGEGTTINASVPAA